MNKLAIADLDVSGKRVFVRVDYNVPLDGSGLVADDRRIQATLPTLRDILGRGGKVIAASHLGRPGGRVVPDLSLRQCALVLEKLLNSKVGFCPASSGREAEIEAAALRPGEVLLLENLRFDPGEESNDDHFAAALAGLADLYVNDAFGSAHRAHASVSGICGHFEQPAAGILMAREIDYLSRLLDSPGRPYTAILGGAKVSDKIELIENLLPRVNSILIGGAMVFTFLKARGIEIGDSLVENGKFELARELEASARAAGVNLVLASDHVLARSGTDSPEGVSQDDSVPPGMMGGDVGPRTATAFSKVISGSSTILWNGPVGRFEVRGFSTGTRRVATAITEATSAGALSVVGGGDSAAAVKALGLSGGFSHISTGGGASLEFLSGRTLPGVAALADE
jgi:phosphoglycerate kinase